MPVTEVPTSIRRLRVALPLAALSALILLVASAAAATFPNPALIHINDRWGKGSSPYPRVLAVSGLVGTITHMTVTLNNIDHLNPDDFDMLLVGPGGQTAIVMSDVGGAGDTTGVTLTLDDAAGGPLPDAGPLASGTFQPTNAGTGDTFPDYGLPTSTSAALSTFNGTDPNGNWSLFVIDDGTGSTGNVNGGWSLAIETGGAPAVFTTGGPIAVADAGSVGLATPYPSTISVSGLAGTITDVDATLSGFTHTFPDDVDILLVGPTGANTILMSDACNVDDVSLIDLRFDDGAAAALPDTVPAGQPCTSGTYQPSSYVAGDVWPAPAGAASATVALANFNGTAPNGTWSLYVVDDIGVDVGRFAGGWALDITTNAPTAVEVAGLRATPANGGVLVRWRTVTEAAVAGFNVYRGETKLNRSLIAAKALGRTRGAAYRFVDRAAPRHGAMTYRLQLVRRDGTRSAGASTTLVRSG